MTLDPCTSSRPALLQVPFGTFEEVLKRRENDGVRRQLEATVREVNPTNAHDKLQLCRDLAMEVRRRLLCWAAGQGGGRGLRSGPGVKWAHGGCSGVL